MTEEELNYWVDNLCSSKADEFKLIGYEHISAEDVWECVNSKYIKSGTPALHQMVNDILSLKVTKLMNHMTMNAYKGVQY